MTIARIGVLGIVAAAAVTLACGSLPRSKTPMGDMAATAANLDGVPAELTRVLKRVMARPEIRAEHGFTARVLVAPGEVYDPLFMRNQAGTVWINDLGGQDGDFGSQIVAIDRQGGLSTVVALGRLLPTIGFDIAPASFGRYRGQIFTLAQPEVTDRGADKDHIVQRIDPMTKQRAEVFCTLPRTGDEGIAGKGVEGRFGPEGSPFAGKFFANTTINYTIYQATPDGRCAPFATFDAEKWGFPVGLTFSPDGQHMLVSTLINGKGAAIARVRGDGTIEPEPMVRIEQRSLAGMAYAPDEFGHYAGQLFVASTSGFDQASDTGGHVYRLTPEGDLKLVASGLRTPLGVHFVEGHLWVSNISNAFILGHGELPDGFVVEITPTR